MKDQIIKTANKVAKASFMDYPEYDADNPIDNLADALTVLVAESGEEDLGSAELYDFLKGVISEVPGGGGVLPDHPSTLLENGKINQSMYTFIIDYIEAMTDKGKLSIHETALMDSAKGIIDSIKRAEE
jgi:hypothetical protein